MALTEYNLEYSHQDFTNKSFLQLSSSEFSNTTIVDSCFHQSEPFTMIFPFGTRNVTFIGCNLDNVVVPTGCTLTDCTNKTIRRMNDGCWWQCDAEGVPVVPTDRDTLVLHGLNIDPKKIPSIERSVLKEKLWADDKAKHGIK